GYSGAYPAVGLNAAEGWRHSGVHAGDLGRYLQSISQWLERWRAWNRAHGWRALPPVLFTTGGGATWSQFELDQPALNAVAQLAGQFPLEAAPSDEVEPPVAETSGGSVWLARSANVRSRPAVSADSLIGRGPTSSRHEFEFVRWVSGQEVGGENQWAEVRAYIWKPLVEELAPAPPPGPLAFRLTHWPTPLRGINQRFGANPQNYAEYGLPGHDGVDIQARRGDPVCACAAGSVYRIHLLSRDGWHNYGNHIRLEHAEGYKTVYAHLDLAEAGLDAGQAVQAGQRIGRAGSTGNSSGPHLHFAMKRPPGAADWPFDLIDPHPFLDAIT
ncbi:MAG: M23 family metallopeptidase, partial [Candidatus Promineifilaceae bacterium]